MAPTLRPATTQDARFLYAVKTDPVVLEASLIRLVPAWEAHCDWLDRALNDPDRELFVIEVEGQPVGYLRLDILDSGRHGEVSIALQQSARGHGVGTEALKALLAHARDTHRLAWLEAVIREENTPSRKAFTKAGFSIEEIKEGLVHMAKYLGQ